MEQAICLCPDPNGMALLIDFPIVFLL